jgi:allophanate hydrolase
LANKLLVCHDAGSEFAIRSAKPDTLCEGRYAMPRFDSLSLSSLREAYAAGARPSDLVATIYDRVRDGPIGPAWIHLRPREEALRACAEIEARYVAGQSLPLYGVPFGVKDNIDVAGMPTTAACPAFSYAPERSARSVELLLAAGAVCLGKTNLDQFAAGLSGTRSPYGACGAAGNPLYVSGGSSSGSAAVVASGVVSFALGTDTGGSGRIPAGFNGIVGIKPTVGRISTRGLVPNCPTLDCVSVFALSVDDGMQVLRVIEGFDVADPFSRPAPSRPPTAPRSPPFRYGVLAPRHREWYGMPECARIYEAACERLCRLGDHLIEIDFAPFREAGQMLFDGPWIAERHAALAPFINGHAGDLFAVTRSVLQTSGQYSAGDAFTGIHRLAQLRRAVAKQFATIDALMVPTAPRPFTIAEMTADPIRLNNQLGHYSYFANLLDLCGVAIPCGVLSCGVAMGVTLLAPAWADERVANLARRFDAPHAEMLVQDATAGP